MQNSEKLEARMQRGTKQLFIWTFAWVLSNAVVVIGSEDLWHFSTTPTVIAIAVNLMLGVKMLFVFKQHLNDMDEMQRKIHFNAMAISLGCTMILGSILGMLEPTKLIQQAPSPSVLLIVMSISYISAVFINLKRYL